MGAIAGKGAAIGKEGANLKAAFDNSANVSAGEMKGAPGSAMGSFAPGAKAGSGPATSDANLALSAAPFAHDFEKNGLKVALGPDGKPQIVNQSGRPASEPERQRLLADIRAEPAASAHDQNFFNPSRGGVSREDFGALKETLQKDPASCGKDCKHIVLTPPGEEKDFTRSQSCEIVSGECNPHAKKSYVKGELVPAGDLGRIAAALRDRLFSANERHDRARASGGGRMGGFMGRLASIFGRGDGLDAAASGGAGAPGASSGGSGASDAGDAHARPGEAQGGATPHGGGSNTPSTGLPPFSPTRVALLLAGLAGTGLMFGAVYVLVKRDRKSWNR